MNHKFTSALRFDGNAYNESSLTCTNLNMPLTSEGIAEVPVVPSSVRTILQNWMQQYERT